jgi:hypothetical protein
MDPCTQQHTRAPHAPIEKAVFAAVVKFLRMLPLSVPLRYTLSVLELNVVQACCHVPSPTAEKTVEVLRLGRAAEPYVLVLSNEQQHRTIEPQERGAGGRKVPACRSTRPFTSIPRDTQSSSRRTSPRPRDQAASALRDYVQRCTLLLLTTHVWGSVCIDSLATALR